MTDMTRRDEQGIALVFTLFLMASLSALAVSLMFLAQTETSSTRNYRTMSQARYAGEAGVHKAINYLVNTYPVPTSTTGYDASKSPVEYGGSPVVLSATTGVGSNYPDSAVISAFNTAAQGSLSVSTGTLSGTVGYTAYATLVSIRQVTVYGGGPGLIQTWQITAAGTVPGAMPATVEVTAMLERNFVSSDTYAIFATGAGCGAIDMVGNVNTDSYDSTSMTFASGHPVSQATGGGVGTNGNLSISGHVTVNGNLDTPRTGVGACDAGTPTAFTGSGSADLNGDIVQLPQAKTYPTPALPSPLPPTSALGINSSTSTCLTFGLVPPVTCTALAGNVVITANGGTISLGNVSLTGGANLTIKGGTNPVVTLNVNTLSLAGNSTITLDATTSVVMNVVGQGVASGGTVLDFTGGALTNGSFDPSKFQIVYAGTNEIKVGGGSDTSATIYAPNAFVDMNGNAGFYGSVLSNTFKDNGGASVHYDRSLSSKFFTLGNYVLTSFSWKKY